ncbi:MAG TPA: peroxiredoxin family protein [Pirellulales bacterium]|jgi:peroxiredoxin|nr:peroxiredoxin family protein [Pirellulales bacterium]
MNSIDRLRKIGARRWLLVGAILALAARIGLLAYDLPLKRPGAAKSEKTVRANKSPEHGGTVHFDLLAKLLADDRRSAPKGEWRRELLAPNPPFRVATQSCPLVGRAAPDFTLSDHRGKPWNLKSQLKRGPVVLVFYLGFYCNYCVHDLFELNADLDRFHELGAEVIAISGDGPGVTRQRFEQFGAFGFPVLSDPGHAVARSYGMFRPEGPSQSELLLHGTFVIGRDGQVSWVGFGDLPFRNDMALLFEVARLGRASETNEPRADSTARSISAESQVP